MTRTIGVRAEASGPLSVLRTLCWSYTEARPIVLWVFNLRFLVGGMLAFGGEIPVLKAVGGGASWFLAVWVVYLVNGISDIAGDRANGSHRPLASGALTTNAAGSWCVVLAVASLAIAVHVTLVFVLLVVLMLTLGLAYSLGAHAAKKWAVPALAVAASGGLLTYLAGAEAFHGTIPSAVPVFAVVMALWIAVVGHAKDFGDAVGDRIAGRRTLPIVLGERAARLAVATGSAAIGGLGVLAAALNPALLSLAALGPCAVAVSGLSIAGRGQDRRAQRRPYRAFMVSQYTVNLLAVGLAATP
ncbi:UbiA family prenyltransferase [Leifsonia sp. NCR5]|uniref:UbiA family prenyltransferase n=1 Tax=Leifsonia sp. NCR5 TaxID=1978342 RepID=UPI000A19AB21|nr:UbiA family prenyltransferase [Leifsonia sp. NCR5]